MNKTEQNLVRQLIREAIEQEIKKEKTMSDISMSIDVLENIKIAAEENPQLLDTLTQLSDDIINLRQTTERLKELLDEYN